MHVRSRCFSGMEVFLHLANDAYRKSATYPALIFDILILAWCARQLGSLVLVGGTGDASTTVSVPASEYLVFHT